MKGAENPARAQALVLVDEFARCGMSHAVLAPGSRSAALAMALHEDPRIALHVEIDERSAGFLALGIARAARAPVAVLTTSGTATANVLPAVVEADAACVPLIVLTADRPPELRGTGANQTIDQVKLYGDRVRWFCEVGVAENAAGQVPYWRATACQAWARALGSGPPAGPVHLNVPTREPTVPTTDDGRSQAAAFDHPLDGRSGRRPWTAVRTVPRIIPEAELTDLAGRIAATERGLVVVGDTSARLDGVHHLARAAGWPVIAEPMAGLRGYDTVVGTAGLLLGNAGFAAAHRPDLVLRIGRQGLSRAVADLLGSDVPQILIEQDGQWLDPGRSVTEIVVADPVTTVASLARLLGVATTSEWMERWHSADRRVRSAVDHLLDDRSDITEPLVAREVSAAVPDGGTLVVSSSMPIRDLDHHMVPRGRLRVLANRGASGIDGVVSTTLGVALGTTGPVLGLLGDLALLHDAGGLLLRAAADRVDCTFVVVNNDGGGIFSFLPQARYPLHFETVFGTPHGRDPARLAALHDLPHERVDDPGLLRDVVGGHVAAGGVRIVEVRTQRRGNAHVHAALRAAVDEVLAPPTPG